MPLYEFWFIIKRIQLTACAGTEDHEHLFRLCREMSVPRGKWFGRINLRPDGVLIRQCPFLCQQAG